MHAPRRLENRYIVLLRDARFFFLIRFPQDQLWRSTVEALECRSTWEQRQCPVAMAGPAVRQAYLALYGMSSELFQAGFPAGQR